jgi:putative heme-binding domain-containing protein
MGDTTRGRIYRVTPKGHKAYKVPDVDFAKTERLLQAIKSPNLASRQFGVAGLLELPAQSANEMGKLEDLFRSVTDQSSDPALRARGLRIHARLSQTGINYWLGDLLLHSDPRIRQSVIRIFNEQRGIPPHNFVSHGQGLHWANVLKDTSAAVRRDALLALARVDPTQTGDGQTTVGGKIIDLAKLYDGQDPFYLAAINIAVGTDAKRREIILADFEKHFPEWNDKTAKLVWELRPPQVIAKLDQKLTDPKLTAEQKAQIMEILAFAEGDTGGKVYLKLLAAKGASAAELAQATKGLVKHLPARWAGLKKSDEMKAALERLLADSKTAPLALEIIQAGELAEYVEPVRSIASQDSQPAENRQAAVRALGGIKTPQALKALLGLWESNILNLEVIDALGRHAGPEAIATLGKIALNGSQAPDLNDAAVAALAGSRPGTQWLLEAHAQKKLPESMVSSVARLLRNSPHQDLRNRALIAFPAPAKLDPKKLPGIATLVTRRGDAEHGREVFRTNKEVACIRCHAVRGVGGNIGPDLSMIGKKGSRENLFESIIRPDKAIGDQYIQWVVLDKRGVSLSGLLIEETPEHIVIRDGFGKDNKLWTKDIEEKAKSKKSVMPDDAVAQMTEQDLIDVVAYLETLRTPALTPESWHILGPFDNGQNDAGLDKAFIPEPASGGRKPPEVDLKATHDGKDDKIGWRTIRLGADGYYNLQAFHRFAARNTVSYLYREIESPADQEVTILIGTDDGCKLWVNGELLLQHRRHEAATPERDTVKVKHRKGGNAVLLKISNGDGPHGFYFTLVSEQELKENAGAPKGGQP